MKTLVTGSGGLVGHSLKELTKVKGYPVDKSEIIELYLQLD